jgi:O-antigen/teichoic acid export membrane protein
MSGIGVVQASLITSQGKSDWWFYYQLARNIVTILTVFLLYQYGVSTIVFALMLEVLLMWPVTLWMVSRLIGLSIGSYFVQFLKPTAAYLGMLAAVLAVSAALHDWAPAWRLIAEIMVGAIVYTGLIFGLCRERILFLIRTTLKGRQRQVQ